MLTLGGGLTKEQCATRRKEGFHRPMPIPLSLFVLCDDGIVTGRSWCDEATFTRSFVVEVLPIFLALAEQTLSGKVAVTFAASVLH